MLDINAPIIPFVEMGNIKLYSTIKELTPMLNSSKAHSVKLNENWVRYDIDNVLMLFFPYWKPKAIQNLHTVWL